jgi:endonuclease/exonuclease/phosphatase family metal-dependent hydrolase
MKVTILILGLLGIAIFIFLAWSSFPWSLSERQFVGEIRNVEPEGSVNNEDYPSVIKIQTWNLGYLYGEGSDGPLYTPKNKSFYEQKLNQLVDEIKSGSPDIVCLQEVDFESQRSFDINQAQYLAAKANYPYFAQAVGWESQYIPFPYWPLERNFGRVKSGGAVLSKYPITTHLVTLLKKPLSQPWWYNLFYPHRYLQQLEILLGEKKIKVINLHLEAYDKMDRQNQIKHLVEIIKTEKIDFVAGDFNMLPASATKRSKFQSNKDEYENDLSFDEMIKSGLSEVIPDAIYALDENAYFTFPSSRPERRLDYIFFNPTFKMIKAEVLPSALSDHLPLRATLQISSPKFNPYSQ